ncbi:M20/M25/M40 family metallo-hydrolase [Pseudalkalibacillus sp. A8]|uniref:M20/M25/M40 family metallo-hydrolase n=1 Tax=Pseudalkalibacillus sp. A8 TaxID=3382641 RepID=UPI0038B57501
MSCRFNQCLNAPVISVTKFNCGNVLNVIPQTVELGGTIRSLDPDSRIKSREYLEQIIKGITDAHGANYEIQWDLGYPAIVNHIDAVNISRTVVEEVYGKEKNLINVDKPLFGTEDFSSFSEIVPTSIQFIGVHNNTFGNGYPLHHPKFKIDEKALQYGVDYFVKIVEKTERMLNDM